MARYPTDAHYPEGGSQPPAVPPFMDQADLPLEAPPAPDDDPLPPKDRELP